MVVDQWLARLPRRDWAGWLLCAVVIAAAILLRIMFPLTGAFITFYPAVLFCALIGGRQAGLLAWFAGLAISPFFIASPGTPWITLWPFVSWVSFAVFGIGIVMAIDFQQRTLVKSRQLTEQFRRQQHFTDHVIAAAPSLTYIYDIGTGSNVFISEQSREILGYSSEEIGSMGAEVLGLLLHPDDAPRVAEQFRCIIASGSVRIPEIEYRMRRKDGSWVWLLSRDRVFTRAADGRPLQILGVATDITARKRFEEQLLASEERFRGIFENAPTGISISDIGGNFVQCNPAYERILGYSMAELRDASFTMLVHPEDRAANLAEMERLVRQEIPYFEIFNRSLHKSGRVVWVHKFVLLLRDRQGQPVNIVALLTDMTERKQQEEQIRLLMREVNHRSKNLLSVVQSVARQTASFGDPQSFAKRFSERLQGLSASHDLLVHNSWQGVELDELVRSQLSHFEDLVGGRISISGAPLRVNAAAAQSLGMALHELSVNAGKYGALSSREGCVSISWLVEEVNGGKRFTLFWRESGGPAVGVPQQPGLGNLILTRLAEQALGGEAALTFEQEGVSWRLTAPLSNVAETGLFVPL